MGDETEKQPEGEELRASTVQTLDSGLATLDHVVHPSPTLRPAMLLLRGRMGRETLKVADKVTSGFEGDMEKKYEEVVAALKDAMTITVEQGGHDRGVLHSACMELVDLYQMQLVPGSEKKYANAARHYLYQAYTVKQTSKVLQDGLQEMGLTELAEEALADLPAQAREELLSAGSPDQPSAEKLTTLCVLHYFVALERERGVWPSTAQGDLTTSNLIALHRFLLENFEPYKEKCCCTLKGEAEEKPMLLAGSTRTLPAPAEETEEAKGQVCVQWWQGRGVEEPGVSKPTIDMVMMLDGSQVHQLRIKASEVRKVQQRAAALRHTLERKEQITQQNENPSKVFKTFDEQTDAQLEKQCKKLIKKIGDMLARAKPQEDSDSSNSDADEIAEQLECTLELATNLTHMFDVDMGVNATDEKLCDWLKEVLEGDD